MNAFSVAFEGKADMPFCLSAFDPSGHWLPHALPLPMC
jgi:hypothetical protein